MSFWSRGTESVQGAEGKARFSFIGKKEETKVNKPAPGQDMITSLGRGDYRLNLGKLYLELEQKNSDNSVVGQLKTSISEAIGTYDTWKLMDDDTKLNREQREVKATIQRNVNAAIENAYSKSAHD